jgi:hypothetical protein
VRSLAAVGSFVDDTATTEENEVMLEYSIMDTGCGFTQEEAGLILKPFCEIDGMRTVALSSAALWPYESAVRGRGSVIMPLEPCLVLTKVASAKVASKFLL